MDLKNLLNEEQYDAATTVEGPLLILAGAGSGKTRVLTYRMAHMVKNLGIYPSQILAITFTNKAAGEMKDRIKALVGDEANSMWVSTFHSSCVRILRREADKIGFNKNFTIYDTYDQKSLIKQCMKELQIDDKQIADKEIIGKIGEQKDNLISPVEFKKLYSRDYRMNKIADMYILYQKKLKAANAMDFDDLIYNAVELLMKNGDVLEFYQRKFKYIMVDEYQDTNKSQYELVRLLANKHKNICVVGDDDQCLREGTMLQSKNGSVRVEDLVVGDMVQCGAGNGTTAFGTIDEISKREYKGKLIKVITESGKEIKATPNHITFARINELPDKYYVYLMYKKGFGYKIGETCAEENLNGVIINGLDAKINGEQADKLWILKVCDTKEEATYFKETYSMKYEIPTGLFNTVENNSSPEELINFNFKQVSSINTAEKLMEENYLDFNYPHYFGTAGVSENSSRKIISLNFFSGKQCEESGCFSHEISFNTKIENEKNNLIESGFFPRIQEGNTLAQESDRVDYEGLIKYAKNITKTNNNFEIIKKGKFTKDKSFYFMPIGSLKEGMSIAIKSEQVPVCKCSIKENESYGNKVYGDIIEDKIVKIEVEEYEGMVYDLSIPKFRQYLANDVLMHNCIYAWRGADIRNILEFEGDYPNAKVVKLEQNYRSVSNILDAANQIIKLNIQRKDKVLRTDSEAGEKIKTYRAYSDLDEGQFALSQIRKLIDSENRSYKDFAILYRTNAQSRIFEETFVKSSIPYKIVGGTKFYDRKEIKDMMAYLKFINNPADDISLKRIINVPKRNIGDTTVQKVQEFSNFIEDCMYNTLLDLENIPELSARSISSISKFMDLINNLIIQAENLSVSAMLKDIIEHTGYIKELKNSKDAEDLSRVENVEQLVSAAVEFENTAEDTSLLAFLEKVALVSDLDSLKEEANSVVMMTIHSSKGLEFPVVFMAGMENGLFPSFKALDDIEEMEESRRLCYVGITRAREKLYMTSAERRSVFGKISAFEESDFMREISEDLKEDAIPSRRKSFNSMSSNSNVNYNRENKFVRNELAVDSYGSYNKENNYNVGINLNKDNSIGTDNVKGSINIGEKNIFGSMSMPQNIETRGMLTAESAKMGKKVKHSKFGTGTIVSVSQSTDGIRLTIAFDNMGIKTLMLGVAPLEVI